MKIAVDVVSGESEPKHLVQGALQAVAESDIDVTLVGDENVIQQVLKQFKYDNSRVSITHASEVIAMHETPAKACRSKKDASVMVASKMVTLGEADGFFSPGNTGATLTAALMNMKRVPGVSRPAIATILPTVKGHTLLLDAGANVDCQPKHLVQFAIMGEIFVKNILGAKKPKIGLLSIGEEDHKGNELSTKSLELIKKIDFNFVGNIEGNDVFEGDIDVIVCDGFIGNVVLKLSEGLGSAMMKLLKAEIIQSFSYRLGAYMAKGAFRNVKERMSPTTYGGAPLLGVNGCAIVGHGTSKEVSTKNGIFTAAKMAEAGIHKLIKTNLQHYLANIEI